MGGGGREGVEEGGGTSSNSKMRELSQTAKHNNFFSKYNAVLV